MVILSVVSSWGAPCHVANTQQSCVSTAEGGFLRLGGCLWFRIVFPCFLACPIGRVILFVFHLGVLVVRLEEIAVCGYCGVHALHQSVCFLVVFARC